MSIEIQPFAQLLLRGAEAHPERDCMVLVEERATYGQLADNALHMARSLLALGVARGDRVGLLMANCLDYVAVLFGASLIGAVPVLYNARFKSREIAHVTTDAGVRVVVTNDIIDQHTDFVELLYQALPGLSDRAVDSTRLGLDGAAQLQAAIFLGTGTRAGFMSRETFLAGAQTSDSDEVLSLHNQTRVEETAAMFYTSGTTAMPKGCPLSHVVLQYAGLNAGRSRFRLREGDVMWGPLPMFHTAFTQPLTGILDVGGTYVSMTHFNADDALALIEQEGVTAAFPAFPTVTLQLLNHPRYTEESLRKVRVMLNVGPPEELRAMQARMPYTKQVTAFGMTECGGSAAICDPDDSIEQRSECSGPALPGYELSIRAPDTGTQLAAGERGEITVRGPGVFAGYYNAPEKNAESFYPGGWFRTGDLGEMDAEGRVAFRGRLKDMLKVGGENVAAVEVEGLLAMHPAVNLAQVVGMADAKYGEVPVAFIELKPGAQATEADIIEFCQGQIASFKVPRLVRFVEEWPMGATKILKYVLKEQLERPT